MTALAQAAARHDDARLQLAIRYRRLQQTACVALAALLSLLMLVTVHVTTSVPPRMIEEVRNAQLFHQFAPSLLALPPLDFVAFSWLCVVGLWLVYFWFLWQVKPQWIDMRLAVSGGVLLTTLAVLIPPLFTTDIFSYAIFGRMASIYDVNPYLTTAARSAPTDPLMPYLYWTSIPSPYGPLWSLISWVATLGRHEGPMELALRFKLLAATAVMADGWMIYWLVRQRWAAFAPWSYVAFAWNPLVLIEGVALAHNDTVILAFVLFALVLMVKLRPTAGSTALVGSALVKYSTLPLIGVAVVRYLRRSGMRPRLTTLLASLLAGALLIVASFVPFWSGIRVLQSTASEPERGINNPVIMALAWLVIRGSGGRIPAGTTVGSLVLAASLFATFLLVDFARHRADHDSWSAHDEVAAWARTLAAFLVCWPRIHTWYLLPPLGLAIAAGPRHRRLILQVLLLSVASYVSYFH